MDINVIQPYIRSANCFPWKWDNTRYTIACDARLFYVVCGRGTILIEGMKYNLAQGAAVLFQAGTRYMIQKSPEDTLEVICICFDFTFAHSKSKDPLPIYHEMNFHQSYITERFDNEIFERPLFFSNLAYCKNDLLEILGEQKTRMIFFEGKVSSVFKNVIISMARQITAGDNSMETVEKIIQFINTYYGEELNNQAIAAEFHYHPYYLSRLIKNATGLPLHKYIMNCRIDAAMKLLVSTDLSLEEIALRIGFKNQSHFSECFRKKTKKSPSEFRNQFV